MGVESLYRKGIALKNRSETALGTLYGFSAYLLWGFLPIYFVSLEPIGAWELVSWRVLFSLAFCMFLLLVTRKLRGLSRLFQFDKTFWLMTLASLAIFCNWVMFVYGTSANLVVEIAMGYFLNPLVVALLGVIVLREKLRPLQWLAIVISAFAVGYLILMYGQFPYVAIGVTVTFASYSLLKRIVGPKVGAIDGLTLETILMIPLALIVLIVVSQTSGLVWGTAGVFNTLWLTGIGVATAIPLLLFAAAARRITLVSIAMLQFISPILAFLTGVFILHEDMPTERWIGFIMIWIAVIIIIIDASISSQRARRKTAKLIVRDPV